MYERKERKQAYDKRRRVAHHTVSLFPPIQRTRQDTWPVSEKAPWPFTVNVTLWPAR